MLVSVILCLIVFLLHTHIPLIAEPVFDVILWAVIVFVIAGVLPRPVSPNRWIW